MAQWRIDVKFWHKRVDSVEKCIPLSLSLYPPSLPLLFPPKILLTLIVKRANTAKCETSQFYVSFHFLLRQGDPIGRFSVIWATFVSHCRLNFGKSWVILDSLSQNSSKLAKRPKDSTWLAPFVSLLDGALNKPQRAQVLHWIEF